MKMLRVSNEVHDWLVLRLGSYQTLDSLLRKKLGLAARLGRCGGLIYPVAALVPGQSITLPHSRGLVDALRRARAMSGRKYRRFNGLAGITIIRDE